MGRPPSYPPPLDQVTHYGFNNPSSNNCANSWGSPKGSYAQANQWTKYSQSNPYYRDQATDLTYWYNRLKSKESKEFTYVYVLDFEDLADAMDSLSAIVIIAPGDVASGDNVDAQILLPNPDDYTSVKFYIKGTDPVTGASKTLELCSGAGIGTKTERAEAPTTDGDPQKSYSCFWDSYEFPNGPGVQFSVEATHKTKGMNDAAKAFAISNDGPAGEFISPAVAPALFPHGSKTKIEVQWTKGASIRQVKFFRRVTIGGTTSKTVISTTTTGVAKGSGWIAELDVADLPAPLPLQVGVQVFVDAEISDGTDPATAKLTTISISGYVSEENKKPSSLQLSPALGGATLVVPENSVEGTLVGTLTTSDPNRYDTHVYTIVGGSDVYKIAGNSLLVKSPTDYESRFKAPFTAGSAVYPTGDEQLTIKTKGGSNCALPFTFGGKTYHGCTMDANPTGSKTMRPWCCSSSTCTASKYKICEKVTARTSKVTVRTTDSGLVIADGSSSSLDQQFTITLDDVNEPATKLEITGCEDAACTTISKDEGPFTGQIGTIAVFDPDYTDYPADGTKTACGNGVTAGGRFRVKSTCAVDIKVPLDYESASGGAFDITATATSVVSGDKFTGAIKINVNNLNEAPTAIALSANSVDEGKAAGFVVGTLSAVDPDTADTHAFSISGASAEFTISGNKLVTKKELNYEDPAYKVTGLPFRFTLQIKATDSGTPRLDVLKLIYVYLNDVAEPPSLGASAFGLDENSPKNSFVGIISGSTVDVGKDLEYFIKSGNTASAFRLDTCSGVLFVETPLVVNYEALLKAGAVKYTLNVEVQVKETCEAGAVGPCQKTSSVVEVTIRNINEAPLLSAATFSINENVAVGAVVTTIKASSLADATSTGASVVNYYDPDNENLVVATPTTAAILDAGKFTIEDGGGAFDLAYGNTGSICGLVGAVSTCTYIKEGLQLRVKGTRPNYETQKDYALVLKVEDKDKATAFAAVTITVNNLQEPPVFDVPSYTFNLDENSGVGTKVGYAVSASDEDTADAGKLVYSLATPGAGEDRALFKIDSSTGQISVKTDAVNYEAAGGQTYKFRVLCKDPANNVGTASIIVNIKDLNEAPVFTNNAPTATVPESANVGTNVITLAVADPDAVDTKTFVITSVVPTAGASSFKIDTNTGQITVQTANLDHETNPTFTVSVQVADKGSLTDTVNVVVTISDVNEIPNLGSEDYEIRENALADTSVALEGSSTATGVWADAQFNNLCAFDPDGEVGEGDTLTYAIESGNTNNAFKLIAVPKVKGVSGDCAKIVVKTSSALNYEGGVQKFVLRVSVTDGSVGGKSEATFDITVLDANDFPSLADAERLVGENSVKGAVVGAPIVAADEDTSVAYRVKSYAITAGNIKGYFEIVDQGCVGALAVKTCSEGQIKLTNAAQIKTLIPKGLGGTYPPQVLTVEVTDAGGAKATAKFTVKLVDQNDRPELADASFSGANAVREDAKQDDVVGTITATDVDIPKQVLRYEIVANNVDSAFKIGVFSGQISVNKNNVLDFEARSTYALLVKVTDDGSGKPANAMSDTATITIDIQDLNEAPTILATVRSVSEAQTGGNVGLPVTGTDVATNAVEGTQLSYQLLGNAAALKIFTIGVSTGQLSVIPAGAYLLNYEDVSSYTVNVKVTDNGQGGHLSDQAVLTINILNENDAPTPAVMSVSLSIEENAVNDDLIGTFSGTDEDASDVLTYAVGTGNCWYENAPLGTPRIIPSTLTGTKTGGGDSIDFTVKIHDARKVATHYVPTITLAEDETLASGYRVYFSKDTGGNYQVTAQEFGTSFPGTKKSESKFLPPAAQLSIAASVKFEVKVQNGAVQVLFVADGVPRESVLTAGLKGVAVPVVAVEDGVFGDFCLKSVQAPSATEAFKLVKQAPGTGKEAVEVRVKDTTKLDFEAKSNFGFAILITDTDGLAAKGYVRVSLANVNESPVFPDVPSSPSCTRGAGAIACHEVSENLRGSELVGAGDFNGKGDVETAVSSDTGVFSVVDTVTGPGAYGLKLDATKASGKALSYTINRRSGVTSVGTQGSMVFSFWAKVSADYNGARSLGSLSWTKASGGVAYPDLGVTGLFPAYRDVWEYFSVTKAVSAAPGTFDLKLGFPCFDASHACNTGSVIFSGISISAPKDTVCSTCSVVGPKTPANDPDLTGPWAALTYRIVSGNVNGAFALDAATAQLSLVKSGQLDFEGTAAEKTFNLVIGAADAGTPSRETTAKVTVQVTDYNEEPDFNDISISVDENSIAGTQVGSAPLVAIDRDSNPGFQVDHYELVTQITHPGAGSPSSASPVDVATGEQIFKVAPTGELLVNKAILDHEKKDSYTVTVRAFDKKGLSDEATVTVIVNDVNEKPTITNAAFTVEENVPKDFKIGAGMTATDPDEGQFLAFTITGGNEKGIFAMNPCGGQLQVLKAAIDFEAAYFPLATATNRHRFTLQVTVCDNDDVKPLCDVGQVTVDVQDVNEAPVYADASVTIAENSDVGDKVDKAVVGTDVDGDTLSYSITNGNDDDIFAINSGTGFISVKTATLTGLGHSLNYERSSVFVLEVTANDNAALTKTGQATTPAVATARVTVTLLDINEKPDVTAYTGANAFAIDENSGAGALVGIPVAANDVDNTLSTQQTLVFTIVKEQATFDIDSATGQLSVKLGADLNFESTTNTALAAKYTAKVKVEDSGNIGGVVGAKLSTEVTVEIDIIDVNERPTFEALSMDVDENSATGTAIGFDMNTKVTDPDGGSVHTFSIIGGDSQGAFAFSGGQLSVFKQVLDFEKVPVYKLTVKVEDNGVPALNVQKIVTITVFDVNEQPSILPSWSTASIRVDENTADDVAVADLNTFSATDLDMGDALTYTVTGGDGVGIFDFVGGKIKTKFDAATAGVTGQTNSPTGCACASDPTLKTCACCVVGATVCMSGPRKNVQCVKKSVSWDGSGGPSDREVACLKVSALDFEQKASYTLQLTATDKPTPADRGAPPVRGAGSLTAVTMVTITVVDLKELPFADDVALSVPEKSAKGMKVGRPLVAWDADTGDKLTFTITSGNQFNAKDVFALDSNSGQLSVTSAESVTSLVYKCSTVVAATASCPDDAGTKANPNAYTLVIQVADQTGKVSTFNAVVDVTNKNFPPTMVSKSFKLDENVGVGTVVGLMQGVDLDTEQSLKYIISKAEPAEALLLFEIVATGAGSPCCQGGQIKVKRNNNLAAPDNSEINFEKNQVYTLEIVAQDSGPGKLEVVAQATINLNDINEAPRIGSCVSSGVSNGGSDQRHVPENSAVDVAVGSPVTGTDVDAADKGNLVYSITAPASHPFKIDAATGQIRVKTATLNYEPTATTSSSYDLKVTITDVATLTAVADVKVRVTDVNEDPSLAAVAGSAVNENDPAGTPVVAITTSDEDLTSRRMLQERAGSILGRSLRANAGGFTYAIVSGNVPEVFALDAANQLVLASAASSNLDFESKNKYDITVSVTDAGVTDDLTGLKYLPITTQQTFTVTVKDVNDVIISGVAVGSASTHAIDALATKGNDPIVITGQNFGNVGGAEPTIKVTYGQSQGYTATGCTRTKSNTEITCKTAEGLLDDGGVDMPWVVTVDPAGKNHASPPSSMLSSYAKPTIATVVGADNMPTKGGTTVTITGNHFGKANPTAPPVTTTAFYGPVDPATGKISSGERLDALNCKVTVSHTTMECTTEAGRGADLAFVVVAASQESAASTSRHSYAVPTVTAADLRSSGVGGSSSAIVQQLRTQGAQKIRLTGTDLGAASPTVSAKSTTVGVHTVLFHEVRVLYGPVSGTEYSATGCAIIEDHKTVECDTAPGVGTGLTWTVVVGLQASTPVGALSAAAYLPPRIIEVTGPGSLDATTVGGQAVILTGDQFGPSVGSGGSTMVVTYGAMPLATRYTATSCTMSTAHTQITCLTVPGTGKGLAWKVDVATQKSVVLDAKTNYARPTVALYTGDGSNRASTSGGQIVRIMGRNFGPASETDSIDKVEYFKESFRTDPVTGKDVAVPTPKFDATSTCTVIKDHEEVECKTVPGVGKDLRWVVTIRGQESEAATTNYAPPVILKITGPGAEDANTEGGQLVIIEGENFGPSPVLGVEPPGGEYLERVTYGWQGTEYIADKCVVKTHKTIHCTTVPGVGAGHQWFVLIKGQISAPLAKSVARTNYMRPSVMTWGRVGDMANKKGPTSGEYVNSEGLSFDPPSYHVVEVQGENFALPSNAKAYTKLSFNGALLDPIPLSLTKMTNAAGKQLHRLRFNLPIGMGDGQVMKVVVGYGDDDGRDQESDAVSFDYDSPVVTDVSTFEGPTPDVIKLVIDGSNFGTIGSVYVIAEDGVSPPTQVNTVKSCGGSGLAECYDHYQVEVYFQGIQGSLYIQDGTGRKSNIGSFRNNDPVIVEPSGKWITTFNTQGGATSGEAGKIKFVAKYVGPGTTVQVGGQECTDVQILQQTCPVIAGLDKDGKPLQGCYSVTCIVPAGQGTSNAVVAHRGTQKSCSKKSSGGGCTPLVVDYKAPVIGNWGKVGSRRRLLEKTSLFPTSGGELEIEGENMGATGLGLLEVSFGATLNSPKLKLAIKSHDHTKIVAFIPAGAGKDHLITVNVGGQSTSKYDTGLGTFLPALGSYEPPTVGSITPNKAQPTRGSAVSIVGTNFGCGYRCDRADPIVTIGEEPKGGNTKTRTNLCKVVAFTDTVINCTAPEGEGLDNAVVVTVSAQSSNDDTTYSYRPPTITSINGTRCSTKGGCIVRVQGTNLGVGRNAQIFLLGNTKTNATIGDGLDIEVPKANFLLWDHEFAVFKAPEGQGADRTIEIRASGQRSTCDAGASACPKFSYDPPEIFSITFPPACTGDLRRKGELGKVCGSPTGGYEIIVHGYSMGNRDAMAITFPPIGRAWKGLSAVQKAARRGVVRKQDHDTMVIVVPPGVGSNHSVIVQIGLVKSGKLQFSYDKPWINEVLDNTVDADGDFIRIYGINFHAESTFAGCRVAGATDGKGDQGAVLKAVIDSWGCEGEERVPAWAKYNESQVPEIYDVNVDGLNCRNVSFELDMRGYFLKCLTPRVRVGDEKALVVSVAGQAFDSSNITTSDGQKRPPLLSARCIKDFYGLGPRTVNGQLMEGEYCERCFHVQESFQDASTGKTFLQPKTDANGDYFYIAKCRETYPVWTKKCNKINSWQGKVGDACSTDADCRTRCIIADGGAGTVANGALVGSDVEAGLCADANIQGLSADVECEKNEDCYSNNCGRWEEKETKWGAEPSAFDGFYLLTANASAAGAENITRMSKCLPARMGRQQCAYVLPCLPKEACEAGNKCNTDEGYYDFDASKKDLCGGVDSTGASSVECEANRVGKCAMCGAAVDKAGKETKFFRNIDGECQKCPDNYVLLIILFVVAICFVIFLGGLMVKYEVNFALVSIGFDYFQVLAIFARSNVKWPEEINAMYRIFASFNFNIDIAAPECVNLFSSYDQKWLMIESVPLGIFAAMLVAHLAILVKKLVMGKHGADLNRHAPRLFGVWLYLMYYMYLYMTTTALDMVNCAPSDPPELVECDPADASCDPNELQLYLQVLPEKCFVPGGTHAQLLPFALMALCVYSVIYPLMVTALLVKNRKLIMGDQIIKV